MFKKTTQTQLTIEVDHPCSYFLNIYFLSIRFNFHMETMGMMI